MSRPVEKPIGMSGNHPVLYGALGALLHLERLVPDDAARLEQACALVWDWFGSELRWTWLSAFDIMPASQDHLGYISCYPEDLLQLPLDTPDPDAQIVANNIAGRARGDYYVAMNAGEKRNHASPYLLAFWSEISEADADLLLPAYSMLQVCVPESWPIDDFAARIRALVKILRVRWGTAGYTFSSWDDPSASADARYRHARRYPGYDLDDYARLMEIFYHRIRSIGWLTFVGRELTKELMAAGRKLDGLSRVSVTQDGDTLVVQAGPRPERGDTNRLIVPEAYREADALLRPIRVPDGEGIEFLGPWSEEDVTKWIQRYERRVS